MVTVALIGADGAGKSTVGRRLEQILPLPAKYIYMGVNWDASNYLLPTTRLMRAVRRAWGARPDGGPPDPDRVDPPPTRGVKHLLGTLKSSLGLVNRMAEEWYRQALAWYYQWGGKIVVFDRHFLADYYARDIRSERDRPLSRRIHGLMLKHVYPRPDLVIFLDAPAEVLYARKKEGTLKALEHRRQEYLQMRHLVEHFVAVDASQPTDVVARHVADQITAFHRARTGTASRLNGHPSRQGSDRPTILVTNAGHGSAIAIIRSLGRRGWRVIAADASPASPGFRSRFAREQWLYPTPETKPRQMVQSLYQAVREHAVDLIIPVTDHIILPLSEARRRFEGLCTLALPTPEALAVVTNKEKTLALAARLGVPIPRTQLVHSPHEALAQARDLDWPVVLKPQTSRLYRGSEGIEALGVRYAADAEALLAEMKRFEQRCPVLLQEYCSGTGLGVELLLYQGQPLAAFQHRRIREIPLTGGVSALRESMALDPVLYRYAVRLLEALNWTGLAMVEFKVGAHGPKLMEINGRVWGSLPLAVRSGMDFPGRLAELYLHGPPRSQKLPDTSYRIGVRARNLELDLVWMARVLRGRRQYPFEVLPGRRQAVAAFFGLLNPGCKTDIFSADDPGPGFAELVRLGRKIVVKTFARKTEMSR